MASVKDVRVAARDAAVAAQTAARQALAQADAALTADRAALAGATTVLAGLQSAATAIQGMLILAAMPADKHQLELDLEANLLLQQSARAGQAAAQDALANAVMGRQRAAAALDRAGTDLTAAQAALAVAVSDDDEANAWRAVLGGAVLAATVTTAKAQSTTDLVAAALGALAVELGDPATADLVQSRYEDATSAAADLVGAVDRAAAASTALSSASDPTGGALAEAAGAFAAARDAARWAAELAIPRLAWALSLLAAVKGGAGAPTAAEQARIDTRAQAAQAPAAHEKAVHDEAVALRHAQADFDGKALLAEAADPHFDRNNDPSLAAERQAVQDAEHLLQQAQANFPQAEAATVAEWDVALPDSLVVTAADTHRSVEVVAKVQGVYANAPGPHGEKSLLQALDDAEAAYGAAIQASADLAARVRAAADRVAAATDAVAATAPVADQRLVASVRGS